jgi:hypothetical protein
VRGLRRSACLVALLAVVAAGASCTEDVPAVREVPGPERGPAGGWGLVDVAADVGLDFTHGAFRWGVGPDPVAMMGGGLCWLDYDDDGWLDLYVVNAWAETERARWLAEGGLPRNALFRNVEGRFEDVSAGSGADVAVRGNGCVAADLDLDGRTDLYVTTDANAVLLWNEGDGTFTDGTDAAGVGAPGWYAGAAVGDVDGDGLPDLFVAGYADRNTPSESAAAGFPSSNLGVRDLLYLNEGRGDDGRATFREVGAAAGLEVVAFEYGLGARFSDLDVDGDLDLYVANDTKPNRLYDNVAWPGGAAADPAGLGFRFEELAGRAGAADPNAGMGVATGDVDADGRPDVFVTNARGQGHAAYLGSSPGTVDPAFVDVRGSLGADLTGSTGWGATFADLDLDADLDLLYVNGAIPVRDLAADAEPVSVLANVGSARFEDAGGSVDAAPLLARGSAVADYDNDGDLDVAVNVIGGPLVLLENTAAGGRWLAVSLRPFVPGAVVTVTLPDGRTMTREAAAGSSYLSSEDPRLHFGLGDAAVVGSVVVRWPDGSETRAGDVAADRRLVVTPP